MRWSWLLLLPACSGSGPGSGTDKPGGSGGGTGGDSAVDTSEPGDSGEPGPTLSLTLRLELPGEATCDRPLRVGLVPVSFGDGGDGILRPRQTAMGSQLVAACEGVELTWSADEEVSQATSPGNDQPDLLAAFFMAMAWEDLDGDGLWSEGEPIAGAAFDRLLTWLGGEVDPAWPEGWSLVDLGLAGQYLPNRCLSNSSLIMSARQDAGYPTFEAVDQGLDLVLRGLPATLNLGGSMSGVEAYDGLVALPVVAFSAEEPESFSPIFDLPAVPGAWGTTLVEPPPDSHVLNPASAFAQAPHYDLLYVDSDGSGGYSPGDALDPEGDGLASTACTEGSWTYTRYTWPVVDYDGLRLLDCYLGQVGWKQVTTEAETDALRFLDSEEAGSLEVDPTTCLLQ